MPTHGRRALRIAASTTLAVTTLAALVFAGGWVTTAQANSPAPTLPVRDLPASRPSSNGPIHVAVALGASGSVGSDALAPFEVFASSPAFSVYAVAATPSPQPTQGGPAIVPTYTFADTSSGRAPRPDVVVVPAVAAASGPAEASLRDWVTQQAAAGARILSVCNGAEILAAAGLLDGRTATAHWSRLGAYAKKYPAVHWVAGKRYVRDGAITSTAGVTSGIPGALRVMADLAGTDEATRVGRLVAYPNWSLTQSPDIPTRSFAPTDLPIALNVVIPWGRPTLGIALTNGISEIDIASTFEVYDVSYAARPIPVSSTGAVMTSHGLVLHTSSVGQAPTPNLLAVPGPAGIAGLDPALRAWAEKNRVPVDAVHGSGRSPGFDGALQYLSAHAGRAAALSAAKMMDYPATQLRLEDAGSGVRIPVLLVFGLLLVATAAAAPTVVRRARTSSATRSSSPAHLRAFG
ncbi:DJ-1/PfpI family protein [Terrabacter aeriphilus]|uniref:DJ-1/PfpI family protein n=1 Tax=Terrabacter aeriphilus TaxID=515662 RepID=A0ABP9JEA9_9MICO